LARVVSVNKLPQEVESPAVPPVELRQAERISARVLISVVGTVMPEGTFRPGVAPVVGSTNSEASVKAAARAEASVVAEPIAEGELINGARAETAATVVSSLITRDVFELMDEQGPTADIIARFGLLLVAPGLPPVAVTKTSVAFEQENAPSIKSPFASEAAALVSKGMAAEPSPLVPTV